MYILITIGKDSNDIKYILRDQELEKVKEEIFTGCTTDYQLDFESHISKKINKVTRMFGLLCRSFSCLNIENFHLLMHNYGSN